MTALAMSDGIAYSNKFYLERALLEYSTKKPDGYLRKCKILNNFLNEIVEEEIRSGIYKSRVQLPKELYSEIFEDSSIN
jgi:hypothetical protein